MTDRENALNELTEMTKEHERQSDELQAKYKNAGWPNPDWARAEKKLMKEYLAKWREIIAKYGNEVAITITIGDVFAAAGIYKPDKKEV